MSYDSLEFATTGSPNPLALCFENFTVPFYSRFVGKELSHFDSLPAIGFRRSEYPNSNITRLDL